MDLASFMALGFPEDLLAEVALFADEDAKGLAFWGLEFGLSVGFSDAIDKDLGPFGSDLDLESKAL